MSENVLEILKSVFGFQSFRQGQLEPIQATLKGRNSLVMLPTGTGKSLCYELPAYILDGLVVIISPLLSLMQDQVEKIKARGERRVVHLTGEQSSGMQTYILKNLHQMKFLFLSPEMVSRQDVLNRLKQINISLLAIDEAHCISEWGMDFRPDYLILGDIRELLGYPTTMALTATATKRTQAQIMDVLKLSPQETFILNSTLDRPEIKFHVDHISKVEKDGRLLDYIKAYSVPTIIYFMSKKECERISALIEAQSQRRVKFYHSELSSEDKVKIQRKFQDNQIDIICATSAFGMGIDKSDIRLIIHYHLPPSPEMYLQEIGRASRDGQMGLAVMLYSEGDELFQRRLADSSLPNRQLIEYIYQNKEDHRHHQRFDIQLAARFKLANIPLDHADRIIQSRQMIKMKQLNAMNEYIHTADCLRDQLMHYFGHERQKMNVCCSNCDHDLVEKITLETDIKPETEYTEKILTWQEKIAKIYQIKASTRQ